MNWRLPQSIYQDQCNMNFVTAGFPGEETDIGPCPTGCLSVQLTSVLDSFTIDPKCFTALGVCLPADVDVAIDLSF
jgi:hypothetical protein